MFLKIYIKSNKKKVYINENHIESIYVEENENLVKIIINTSLVDQIVNDPQLNADLELQKSYGYIYIKNNKNYDIKNFLVIDKSSYENILRLVGEKNG